MTRRPTVHQVLPNMEYGDAITNYALLLRKLLHQSGHPGNIFAQYIHRKLHRQALPLTALSRETEKAGTIWFYHHSTASEIPRQLRELAGRVVLIYHNITPPNLSHGGDDYLAAKLYTGLEDLRSLLDVPVVAVGVSAHNQEQLRRIGFPRTEIMPIAIDLQQFERKPQARLRRKLSDGKVNFITVGRLYPHKKIEDVIRVFHYYHHLINSASRLFVIGDCQENDKHFLELAQLCHHLELPEVTFTGRVRFSELLAYYRTAHVYLCMSEHEGFCVPLLESMHLGVPIIAYNAAAVGETLGEAGILFNEKKHAEIAELAHLLVTDEQLRARVIERQKMRALDFKPEVLAAKLEKILALAQK